MKLASIQVGERVSFGRVTDEGLIDIRSKLGERYPTLRDVLASDGIQEVKEATQNVAVDYQIDDVRFLPVIPNPDKIICLGYNYKAHIDETNAELPENPSLFSKWPSALVGHNQPIVRPLASETFDFEGELVLIIGKGGRHIPENEALSHVAGYTCMDDGSVRAYQKHSVTAGKNFPASGGLGPWMVTADEIPDPSQLTLETRVNGDCVQSTLTSLMVYDIPKVISYVSEFAALEPGDVIATGTPSGVGSRRTPPLWLKAGDVLEVEISGIGTLRNHVVAEEMLQ